MSDDDLLTLERGVITDTAEAEPDVQLPALNDGLPKGALTLSDRAQAFLPIPLEDIRAVAAMLSAMPGVRKEFRTPAACEPIVLQAALWRVSPLFVLQCAYMVKEDAPVGYEAKMMHAVILANAPLSRRPRLQWGYSDPNARTRANRFCRVTYWVIGEDKPFTYTTPTVAQIKVKNSGEWYSSTDKQLAYVAVRDGARVHFPDVLGGAYTREEVMQIRGVAAAAPMFPEDDESEPVDAEFEDHIPPTEAEVAANARWEKKASGEGDSRDPRDDPANNGAADDGSAAPADLPEIRAWVIEEQARILKLSTPSLVASAATRMTDDKRWGRFKAYDQANANLVADSIRKHLQRLKDAKVAGGDPATGEVS